MSFVAPVASAAAPGFGPTARAASVAVLLSADGTACTVNLQGMAPGQGIPAIATLYVDNSAGPIPLTFRFSDTTMNVDVPAFTQGYYPVFTSSFSFTCQSDELPAFGSDVEIPIQIISVPVQSGQPVTRPPNGNIGNTQQIGTIAGWDSFGFTIAGTKLVYMSLEIDCGSYSQPVTIEGIALDGSVWQVTCPGFTTQEFSIPPTLAGGAGLALTSTTRAPHTTKALIPLRWRVASAGVATSTTLPATRASSTFNFNLPSLGTNTIDVPLPGGFGAFIESVTVYSTEMLPTTVAQTFGILDNSGTPTGHSMWSGNFGAGTFYATFPVGVCTEQRGGNVTLSDFVTVSAPTSGNASMTIQYSPVPASQNG